MPQTENNNQALNVISYSETNMDQGDDVRVTVKAQNNETTELIVERFSSDEINRLNKVLKNYKERISSSGSIK